MGLILLVLVIVAFWYYFAKYQPKKEEEFFEMKAQSLESDPFIDESLKTIAFLSAARKGGSGDRGFFCVRQGAVLLIELHLHDDALVYDIKHIDDYVYGVNGNAVASYYDLTNNYLNNFLEQAKAIESRLQTTNSFDDLHIQYTLDPDDDNDEWVFYRKTLPIPSPQKAAMMALDKLIKNHYPNEHIEVIY